MDLSRKNIEFVEKNTFNQFPELEYLSLYRINLKSIDSEMFKGLVSLTRLDQSNNMIIKIQDNSFILMTNLNYLWLEFNKIEEINGGTFKVLNALTR